MKKNLQFLFVFAAMICCCGNVFAGGTYYYDPKIQSNGNGLVYITRQTAPTMNQYYCGEGHWRNSDIKSSSDETHKLWAYPAHGYKFISWSCEQSGWSISSKPITGQGDVVKLTSSSTDSNNPTIWHFKANFGEDPDSLQVVLQRPIIGSISVKSTYYNIVDCGFKEESDTVISSATDVEETKTLIHYSSDKLVLIASDASFSGWYKEDGETKTLLSNESTYEVGTAFSTSVTIHAEFKVANFKVGSATFESIADAITAASNGSDKTVVLLKDYTLTQDVTIPAGVTFLVPNDANYEVYPEAPKSSHSFYGDISGTPDYDRAFMFRKLTLGKGVSLTINGSLNVGGFRWCASYTGVYGTKIPETAGNYRLDQGYGLIDMAANSAIVLNSGANLCCWGRIRGEGTITANSGSIVRECWVNTDYREADAYQIIAEDLDCFPMNQYYIQDIQVATTFKTGAQEILTAGMYFVKTDRPYTGPVNWIGTSNSLFELSGDAYITKHYDVATDRLIYDLYNGVTINDAELNIIYQNKPYSFSTKDKIFDITNNCTINVHSGKTIIKTELALAAGAELNIDSLAEVEVAEHVSLYVFDKNDWDNFACMKKIVPLFLPQYELSATGANFYANHGIEPQSVYSGYATYKMLRTEDNLTDAKIIVNGTLTIKGGSNNMDYKKKSGLYTTNAGAQIISNKSGKVVVEQGAGTQTEVAQLWGAGRGENDDAQQQMLVAVTPAKLLNANGQYLNTADFAGAVTFEYIDGMWGIKKTLQEININEENTIVVEKNENGEETTTENPANTYIIPSGNVVETTDTISISSGSTLVVEENASVDANTVAINSSPSDIDADNDKAGTSSQITGGGYITATNAYIDIKMDPSGKLDGSKYYSFAVPFKVDVTSGVEKIDSKGKISSAVLDRDYRVYTYRGDLRAANGADGSAWEVVSGGKFVPGVFYLVEFADGSCNVFRFHMISGDTLNNVTNLELAANITQTGDGADGGWNGIANTALQNATITVDQGLVAQIFDPDKKIFITVQLNKMSFAVGAAMMIQVADKTTANNSAAPQQQTDAPKRMLAQPKEEMFGTYAIRIAEENATKMADQVFVSASEIASDNYVIGKDLVKMFMGKATVAQLWVNDYGKKLSMNQSLLVNNTAQSSLTLYAPKAGNYKIYLHDIPEDATIYLLENGQEIANLNEGEKIVTLAKGENTQYGLRINAKKLPDVVTSVDERIAEGAMVQKVLMNGVVCILRDGILYNTLGLPIK